MRTIRTESVALSQEERMKLFREGVLSMRRREGQGSSRPRRCRYGRYVPVPKALRDAVVARVAEAYGLEPRQLDRLDRRLPEIGKARQVAMALLHERHGYSCTASAAAFGSLHGVALYALNAVQERRANGTPEDRRKLEELFALWPA
jgi:hypothetical protein